ncbi:thioredoxin domain-containing protein 17 isoform X2 [Galendromus occidentalis]|nr:thioredoxin domain-containing protein 17 isoform X2 [Galendromus occidentalis]
MIRKIVGGLEGLLTALSTVSDQKKTFIYFIGDRNASGESWCPDCRDSDPVVSQALKDLEHLDVSFVTCEVGDKPYWKDPNNGFRNTEKLRISSVPTIIQWNTDRRISDADCCSIEKVKEFLSE